MFVVNIFTYVCCCSFIFIQIKFCLIPLDAKSVFNVVIRLSAAIHIFLTKSFSENILAKKQIFGEAHNFNNCLTFNEIQRHYEKQVSEI